MKWSYSGEGYVYLQRVVESITGQPLDQFLGDTVLLPLGMTQSTFLSSRGTLQALGSPQTGGSHAVVPQPE
jgi:CubicO group peptidase (beta-lactamase class C family)